jgi:hypothetical protein
MTTEPGIIIIKRYEILNFVIITLSIISSHNVWGFIKVTYSFNFYFKHYR